MKVLVVNTVPFDKNGITSVILNYYKNIIKNSIEMDFISINDVSSDIQELFKMNNSRLYTIKNRQKNPFNYMLKLNKILKENKYDIIHIHGNSTILCIELIVAYINRVKVRIAHSHNTTCNFPLIHRILKPLFNFLYTHGIACGVDAGKWLFGNREFLVLNNGIDLELFKYDEDKRNEFREELNISKDCILLGHIGGFVYQKNHKQLIELMLNIKKEKLDVKLCCIGDGPLKDEITHYAKELDVVNEIIFLGKKSNVYDYYNAFDIFVLPSHFEGLPVVLVEAQANGLKCLASNNISDEANLTGNVLFLDNNKYEDWINKIKLSNEDRKSTSDKACESLLDNGYSIANNTTILYKYFLDAMK